ncbi:MULTISPECIES: hypothetical protein [Microbacterium]|uniref:hypothetical protein n=1 Tax=Microbacterium TaxID=33882 RepID=UPI00146B5413|nr:MULTISPECIES: hypothetical protein [Microbacterium]
MAEPEIRPEPTEPPAPPTGRPSHRGRWTAIIGAVAVAVLGATAAAVITPERVDAIFGMLNPAPTASPSATVALATHSVSSADGALTVDVPEDWSAQRSRWNVTEDPGTALLLGTALDRYVDFRNDGAWIGASRDIVVAADVAAMAPRDRAEWLDGFVDLDWSIDGCVPVNEQPRERSGWTVATRVWKECAATKGQRMLEFAAMPENAEVLVIAQVSAHGQTADEVFDVIFDSFVVEPEKVPTQAAVGDVVVP